MKEIFIRKLSFLRSTLAFLLLFSAVIGTKAETYPAECKVKTTLNVRSGPGANYSKVGQLHINDRVVVNSITHNGSTRWGTINFNGRTAYIAVKYVSYLQPIQQLAPRSQLSDDEDSFSLSTIFGKIWGILKFVLIALLILIVLAFWEEIIQIIIFVAILVGIGALVCKLLFNNAGLGANIGFLIAVLIGMKLLIDKLGVMYSTFLELVYKIVSLPIFYSNRLQHILTEPWRYIFKTNWLSDSTKSFVRPAFYIFSVLLNIAITPLRVLNAILYNIVVYGITELYDLLFEVLQPSSTKEGADGVLMWLIMIPHRLIKYPICHGAVTLIEGAIWTVIDTFIPAITMYHGTDLTAA